MARGSCCPLTTAVRKRRETRATPWQTCPRRAQNGGGRAVRMQVPAHLCSARRELPVGGGRLISNTRGLGASRRGVSSAGSAWALCFSRNVGRFSPVFFFLRNRHLSCFHVSLAIRGDLRREPRRGGDAVPGQLQRVRPPSRAVAVRIHAGDLGGRQVPGGEEERLNKSATASR